MDLEPTQGKPRATVATMAAALKISDSERVQLAELIRKRQVPMARDGAVPLDTLISLVRELRGG